MEVEQRASDLGTEAMDLSQVLSSSGLVQYDS